MIARVSLSLANERARYGIEVGGIYGKKLTKSEIIKNIDKLKKDLFNFRFQKSNGQLTSPSKINTTKKSIARLKTMLEVNLNA